MKNARDVSRKFSSSDSASTSALKDLSEAEANMIKGLFPEGVPADLALSKKALMAEAALRAEFSGLAGMRGEDRLNVVQAIGENWNNGRSVSALINDAREIRALESGDKSSATEQKTSMLKGLAPSAVRKERRSSKKKKDEKKEQEKQPFSEEAAPVEKNEKKDDVSKIVGQAKTLSSGLGCMDSLPSILLEDEEEKKKEIAVVESMTGPEGVQNRLENRVAVDETSPAGLVEKTTSTPSAF